MEAAPRVYGVKTRNEDIERLKFCCDFATEEQFNDRFEVFRVDIVPLDVQKTIDPFLVRLVRESETTDWALFHFRTPSREIDTEVVFSDKTQLAVFDEFEKERRSTRGAKADELKALCEGKVVERSRTVEFAVARYLNRILGPGRH